MESINKNPYACPKCGWQAGDEFEDVYLNDCYYKFYGKIIRCISVDDAIETKEDIPDDYYPKRGIPAYYDNDNGYGSNWHETWLCPHCKIEFSFTNGT